MLPTEAASSLSFARVQLAGGKAEVAEVRHREQSSPPRGAPPVSKMPQAHDPSTPCHVPSISCQASSIPDLLTLTTHHTGAPRMHCSVLLLGRVAASLGHASSLWRRAAAMCSAHSRAALPQGRVGGESAQHARRPAAICALGAHQIPGNWACFRPRYHMGVALRPPHGPSHTTPIYFTATGSSISRASSDTSPTSSSNAGEWVL
jgi:hypothetical protein